MTSTPKWVTKGKMHLCKKIKGHLKKNISASSSGFAVMSVLITRTFDASGKKALLSTPFLSITHINKSEKMIFNCTSW